MLPKGRNLTITFKLHYRCDYGRSLYIVWSQKSLENLSFDSAVQLEWHEGDYWSKTIEFQGRMPLCFHYKYIVAPTNKYEEGPIVWEQGLKRSLRIEFSNQTSYLVEDRWEHQKIKVFVRNFYDAQLDKGKGIGLSGPLVKTGLKDPLDLVTMKKIKELYPEKQFWTCSFWLPLTVENLSASAYIIDLNTRTIIKNRRVELFYRIYPEKTIRNIQQGLEVRENAVCIIGDLDLKHFIFTEINEKIILGSSLNVDKEKDLLAQEKVGAILSLETPNDEKKFKVDEKGDKSEADIPRIQFPIEDCSRGVIENAVKGARLLSELIKSQQRVYVHCTYGKLRSVHVVIAYLCMYEGMDLSQAISMVKTARRQAQPSEELCFKMFQKMPSCSQVVKKESVFKSYLHRMLVKS